VLQNKKKQIEKEFRDYLLFASLQNTRTGLWVTFILFIFIASLNEILFPDTEANHYMIRFGALMPIILLSILAISLKRFHKWLPQIFFILTLLTFPLIFLVGVRSDPDFPGYQYYFAWTMLVLMGTMTFYRIRFNHLMIVTSLVVLAFILAQIINGTLVRYPFIFTSNVSFVIDVFFLGFFIAAFRESLIKKIYIRDRELQDKNRDLKKEVRERRLAEIALKESQRNYEGALEALPDWVHVVDRELRFIFMNHSFKEINASLGLETEVIGKHIMEVFPFIPDKRVEEYEQIFAAGRLFVVEELVPVNKMDFFTETRLIPVYKDKKVHQVITVIRDIGKKKEIESLKLKSAEQKEILLREIHHRVKNNLAIVISLLDMQIRSNDNEEFGNMAREVEFRIRSMALIHEHLYKSDELDRVSLDRYLGALAMNVVRTCTKGNVQLIDQLTPVDVILEKAMPLGLIANEILTNACKYAFCEGKLGIITMDLQAETPDSDLYRLTIKDDGKGLPENFTMDGSSSLGMFIVKLLVEQIEGQLIIENKHGSSFSILFKGMKSHPNIPTGS
jgi:PAS domain S-box-containing protein